MFNSPSNDITQMLVMNALGNAMNPLGDSAADIVQSQTKIIDAKAGNATLDLISRIQADLKKAQDEGAHAAVIMAYERMLQKYTA